MEDLKYYRAAMCFIEQGSSGSDFANWMASALYLKQLLICRGTMFKDSSVSVPDLLDALEETGATALCDNIKDFLTNKQFSKLFDYCHDTIISYVNCDDLDYEPYEVEYWCRDFVESMLNQSKCSLTSNAYQFLEEHKPTLISYMCRWCSEDVFGRRGSTCSDIFLQLLDTVHFKETHKYSETFVSWCKQCGVTNFEEMYNKLQTNYRLVTPAQIDTFCSTNMV